MKKILFCTTIILLSIVVACTKIGGNDKDDPGSTPDKPKSELKVDAAILNFTVEGGSNTISVTSTDVWTAELINERADGWCTISPTSGEAGEATITVTTTPNDTTDDRTASIVIKSGTLSKTVKVSQKQKDALTVTSSQFEVAAEGGKVEIEVKANINFDYFIDESAKGWIKYEGTRAMKTSTLTFSVVESFESEKREGKITIKSGAFSEEITIYQAGREPVIVLSQSEYVVPSSGETISVVVKSNVDVAVELSADVDWISENKTRAEQTNTYRFDIQPNESYDQRSAQIKFINKKNNLSETVTVTQAQKDAIVLAKDSYTVDSRGERIEIEVSHNINLNIEISDRWIVKVESTRALVADKFVFDIIENATMYDREGYIVFKSQDGSLSQSVTISQGQGDVNIESPEDGGDNEW